MNVRIRYLSGLALMAVIVLALCLLQLTFAVSGAVSPANSVIGGKDGDAIGSGASQCYPMAILSVTRPCGTIIMVR